MALQKSNQPKILYFIKGPLPTKEQKEKAEKLPGLVVFRNVLMYSKNSSLELCDGVAGFAPQVYKDRFGVASSTTSGSVATQDRLSPTQNAKLTSESGTAVRTAEELSINASTIARRDAMQVIDSQNVSVAVTGTDSGSAVGAPETDVKPEDVVDQAPEPSQDTAKSAEENSAVKATEQVKGDTQAKTETTQAKTTSTKK